MNFPKYEFLNVHQSLEGLIVERSLVKHLEIIIWLTKQTTIDTCLVALSGKTFEVWIQVLIDNSTIMSAN